MLTASAIAFHYGRPQRLRGLHHQLRLFLMYFVAAIRVGNVLFVGRKLRAVPALFLRGVGDIAKVRRDIGCQFACRYH